MVWHMQARAYIDVEKWGFASHRRRSDGPYLGVAVVGVGLLGAAVLGTTLGVAVLQTRNSDQSRRSLASKRWQPYMSAK